MQGLGISPGIGLGKIFIYKKPNIQIEKKSIKDEVAETNRFNEAINIATKEIDELYNISFAKIGEKDATIFTAHRMILEDPEFRTAVEGKIKTEKVNVEWAINHVSEVFISILGKIENEYIQARTKDIKDVSDRLIRILLNIEGFELKSISDKSIIIAEDLVPSDTIQINTNMIEGIITEFGGSTSHAAIIARNLEIPFVSGIKDITELVEHGDLAIVDGFSGHIMINPNEADISEYEDKKRRLNEKKNRLNRVKNLPSISVDGYKVEIAGNIGCPDDIEKVIENGGEGVGLFRTEFLYMDRDRLPTEEEQFEAYKIVAKKLNGKPLVIRTLDVGGDKELPYLDMPKEMNPFLGYRAIRLCLDRKDMFKTQLRAILRASAFGNIKVMFPMISSIQEVREAKAIIEEIKKELGGEKINFNTNIEIGIMIEIPAVAIHSKAFAKEVDFFSIGTNDLIQYTLAVDRGNQNLSYLYNQYHPAVLKLINMAINNGHEEGILVGMCGESAGDERLIPLFLAMGLDEYSVSPANILTTRHTIINTSKEKVALLLDSVFNLDSAEEVEKFIQDNILPIK